jgi:hypothetical protein
MTDHVPGHLRSHETPKNWPCGSKSPINVSLQIFDLYQHNKIYGSKHNTAWQNSRKLLSDSISIISIIYPQVAGPLLQVNSKRRTSGGRTRDQEAEGRSHHEGAIKFP